MKWFQYLIAAALVVVGVASGGPAFAATVVVHPGDTQGWIFAQESGTMGSGALVNGPGIPPLGSGSANLKVGDGASGQLLFRLNNSGQALSGLTQLSYNTYRESGSSALAAAFQLGIDANGTDADTAFQGRLVFEPYLTGASVLDDTWQFWNLMTAANGFWFTNATLRTNTGCSMANSCSLAEVLAALPNIAIHTVFGIEGFKAGSGWTGGFDGNVDDYRIAFATRGSAIYDFEGTAVPAPAGLPIIAGLIALFFWLKRWHGSSVFTTGVTGYLAFLPRDPTVLIAATCIALLPIAIRHRWGAEQNAHPMRLMESSPKLALAA